MAKEKIRDITVYRTPDLRVGNAEYYAIITTFESGDYNVERRLSDESFDERADAHYDWLLQWERQSGEVKRKGTMYDEVENWTDRLDVYHAEGTFFLKLLSDYNHEDYEYSTTRASMRGAKKLINQFLFPEDYGYLPFRGKGKFHESKYDE